VSYDQLSRLYEDQATARARAGLPGASPTTMGQSSAVLQGRTYDPTRASDRQSLDSGGLAGSLGLTTDFRMPYSQLDRRTLDVAGAADSRARYEQMRGATEMANRAMGGAPSVAGRNLQQSLASAGQQAAQQAAATGGANRGLAAYGGTQAYAAGMGAAQDAGVAERMAELQSALQLSSGVREADLAILQQRLAAAQSDQEAYLVAAESDREMRDRNRDAQDSAWGSVLQAGGALLGGAAGMFVGGPAGAIGGASLGYSAGKAASSV
jgi:hypothetical protein